MFQGNWKALLFNAPGGILSYLPTFSVNILPVRNVLLLSHGVIALSDSMGCFIVLLIFRIIGM